MKKVLCASMLLMGANACAHNVAPAQGMVMTTTIVIANSGATNLIGWRVLIAKDGSASWASGDGTGHAMLPPQMDTKFARDIAAAAPLASLPQPVDCMKPVSFGTSTFVTLGGDKSPDLTCPGNDAARALKDDIGAIAGYLHVRKLPRGEGHDLPPENF